MALILPNQIMQGDSLVWSNLLTYYPASGGWAVTYSLRGNTSLNIVGVDAGGGDYSWTLTPADSASLIPGHYSYVVVAAKTGARTTIHKATVTVLPDITTLIKFDGSSHAARMVTAIEALMEGKAEDDVASMSHNGKALARYQPSELIQLHNHYTKIYHSELARERVRLGLATGRQKITRFRG